MRVVARETQETAEISTFFAAQSVGGCYTTNGFDPAVEKEKGYSLASSAALTLAFSFTSLHLWVVHFVS